MDVTLLRHFVAVAEQLHFARAAQSLGISRPALSSSVKALEAELGAELFDRSAERTTLSATGQQLLAESGPLIEAEELRLAEIAATMALPGTLSVAFVPGVTVGKWTLAWESRHPGIALRVRPVDEEDSVAVLRDGIADVSFVRLPVKDHGLGVIPLYQETAVVVVSKDHPIALFDSVTLADLADEKIVRKPPIVSDAVELVAAGVGVVLLPQSIARLHARKDVVARPVTDAPQTGIAIVWIEDDLTAEMEEFIGIVRGRTAASSRSGSPLSEAAGSDTDRAVGSGSSSSSPSSEKSGAAKSGQAKSAAGAAKKPKARQVKHSRGALQARNRKRGGGR
ncbi:DNA-binding transcriptional LysR family regulator [Glaciihabitans tibetensis]|uniref:DNA-binding transcriptional LysR family regulator n=1 Tax=Glaciihabitans tibetensis TaxID=1266600 RepID=A0A2T0VJW5_9MICO|nr:LysR substrate-binding domain-containing protein [Glaciihabitans tibetensis]PRY70483.1 DNA-binding transcriptional LysR family regulator [Glaciihabitans tibetensis]